MERMKRDDTTRRRRRWKQFYSSLRGPVTRRFSLFSFRSLFCAGTSLRPALRGGPGVAPRGLGRSSCRRPGWQPKKRTLSTNKPEQGNAKKKTKKKKNETCFSVHAIAPLPLHSLAPVTSLFSVPTRYFWI